MNQKNKINYKKTALSACTCVALIWLSCSISSCKKYLDIKSDKTLEVPSTLQDCQSLLDDDLVMNDSFTYLGEYGSDNYDLTFATWASTAEPDRDNYIWLADGDVNAGNWDNGYKAVLYANQVLAVLNNIPVTPANQSQWNALKGAALFYRGLWIYQMSLIWTKPYNAATAATDMGIPIRLTPNISEKTVRGTVKQTYDQILQDMNGAVSLLPPTPPVTNITKNRPCQTAAYAALARIYLSMGDYTNAAANSNAALQQYSALIDYNTLNPAATNPIVRFNPEVIFEAQSSFGALLYYGSIDSTLYKSYLPNDNRKAVFFSNNGDGTFSFKGSYSNTPDYIMHTGFDTGELYLTRAECYARAGNTAAAMTDLNTLLKNRFNSTFVPFTAASANAALALILTERRKELLFRGIRWADLRRLNQDPNFAVTLTRSMNGIVYSLPPNDLRYAWLIPQAVLNQVNIPQNPRP
jgi:tetratricopeptide (TPR) repeat protein